MWSQSFRRGWLGASHGQESTSPAPCFDSDSIVSILPAEALETCGQNNSFSLGHQVYKTE